MLKKLSIKKVTASLVLALLLIMAFAPFAKADKWYFSNTTYAAFNQYTFKSTALLSKAKLSNGTTSSVHTYCIRQNGTVRGANILLNNVEVARAGKIGATNLNVQKVSSDGNNMTGHVEYY